jgi:hypothetical protein
MRAAIEAKAISYSARKRGSTACLGADWRRVLENSRAQEERRNPSWIQPRNFREFDKRKRPDTQRRRCGVMNIARSNESSGALVLRLLRVTMDAFVQLRGGRKRDRAEKRDHQSATGDCPPHGEPSFQLSRNFARNFCKIDK